MKSATRRRSVPLAVLVAVAALSAGCGSADEDHPDVRAADGDHQAGKAAAGAEIGHAQGIGRQERDKSLRVSNGLVDGGRADRPAMAQAAQHLMEGIRRGRHLQGR